MLLDLQGENIFEVFWAPDMLAFSFQEQKSKRLNSVDVSNYSYDIPHSRSPLNHELKILKSSVNFFRRLPRLYPVTPRMHVSTGFQILKKESLNSLPREVIEACDEQIYIPYNLNKSTYLHFERKNSKMYSFSEILHYFWS